MICKHLPGGNCHLSFSALEAWGRQWSNEKENDRNPMRLELMAYRNSLHQRHSKRRGSEIYTWKLLP